MQSLKRALLGLALVAGLAQQTAAQGAAAPPAGVRGDILGQLNFAADRLMQLARAIPTDKYTWRPGAGVRSVGEVFSHVASANYYIPPLAGVASPVPITLGQDLPAVTDSTQALALLRRSFEHARSVIRNMSDADLEKAANLFGQPSTNRGVLLVLAVHAHEHLGQLIAYARTNGVVPPWSRAAGM